MTIEENARQWWLERFGTPLPEDVKTWLRGIIRQEVLRVRLEANILDDQTLQRTRESRRLQQTKLSNVEESLTRTHIRQERTRRYIELITELDERRKRLYELNKQKASLLTQQRELERFETFEPMNGRVQRIHTLSRGISLARTTSSQLALEIEEAKKLVSDSNRKVLDGRKLLQNTFDALILAANTMTEGERLTERTSLLRAAQAESNRHAQTVQEQQKLMLKQLEELQRDYEQIEAELSGLRLKRQSLEAHSQMIQKSSGILVMLDELLETTLLRDSLSNEYNQALRRQNERDKQLGTLFIQHQELNVKIEAREEEIIAHRKSIAGQDSFNMQRRALELRSRKLMLQMGLSLWKNISTGYNQIELKSQQITTMRLRADHLNRTIDQLDAEVRRTEALLRQKTYHWTLTKSQNVIEMRGDLQEGKPCIVCGATHHPRSSEELNGQSVLINSLKADCEHLETELANKRRELEEAQQELTATRAKMDVETANYKLLLDRQQQDTAEWQEFAGLDRSFSDCTQSTNREARLTTLLQLIEKTTVDAENAEKELKAFTFHLDAIAQIGEEVQSMRQQLAEQQERLNEANTACQVMAGQVERINQRLSNATNKYRHRYEVLEKLISIPEWFREWKQSPESLKQHIQEMTQQWAKLEVDIARRERDLALNDVQIQLLEKNANELQAIGLQIDNSTTVNAEQASKAEEALHRLLDGNEGKALFQDATAMTRKQNKTQIEYEQEYLQQLTELLTLTTRQTNLDEIILQDEQRVAEERKELDLWMRKYNANNPPVQFAELERVLTDEKDWNDIRQRVRETTIEAETTQARLEYLRTQIIALQAEGIHPTKDAEEQEQQIIAEQLEELEQQRRNILQQIAHYDELLRAHEQACAATGTL